MASSTEAVVVIPLTRMLIRAAVGEAADWLQNNQALVTSVLEAAGGNEAQPVTKAAIGFLDWLSGKVKHEPQQLGGTVAAGRLPLDQAEPLYEAMTIAAEISGSAPGRMVEVRDNRPRLLPPERRVAIGIARSDGEDVPLLLLTVPNPRAEKLIRQATGRIEVRVVGQASSPNASRVHPPTVPDFEHRPGRSVAHCLGNAGSLGAYVTWLDDTSGRPITGFMGASHVMSRLGTADLDDYLHSPGPPDKDRNLRYRYGRLINARTLVHVNDQAAADAFMNDCDIAVARLTHRCVPRNMVPGADPNGPLVAVERALSEKELSNFYGDVYLIGRTTPRAKGRCSGWNISEILIEMPDKREYLFGQALALIESDDPENPFSRPGDSGAMVYGFVGGSCVAVGFVNGAAGRTTYISSAERCLRTMDVELLNV